MGLGSGEDKRRGRDNIQGNGPMKGRDTAAEQFWDRECPKVEILSPKIYGAKGENPRGGREEGGVKFENSHREHIEIIIIEPRNVKQAVHG